VLEISQGSPQICIQVWKYHRAAHRYVYRCGDITGKPTDMYTGWNYHRITFKYEYRCANITGKPINMDNSLSCNS
jgi:hypothetical protein